MSRFRASPSCLSVKPLAGAILLALASSLAAQTLPSAGNVISGVAQIDKPTVDSMVISQTSSGAIIEWGDFSIGAQDSVRFAQPTGGVTLNRVVSAGNGVIQSQINGALTANGRVFIINPAGVLFGATAQVEVGGLVASALPISNADFNSGVSSGQFRFGDPAITSVGDVRNGGTIVTDALGTVALIGNEVANTGTVRTPSGSAVLASARTVTLDFYGDGLTQISIGAQGLDDGRVDNYGTIEADGGQIAMRTTTFDGEPNGRVPDEISPLIRNQGVLRARTLVQREGRILLDAGAGHIEIGFNSDGALGATFDATGDDPGERGGAIELRGDSVLAAGEGDDNGCVDAACTRIDASGMAGGGSVRIRAVHAVGLLGDARFGESGLLIAADALERGDGGEIDITSDGAVRIRSEAPEIGGVQSAGALAIRARGQLAGMGDDDERGRGGAIGLDAGAGNLSAYNTLRFEDSPGVAPLLDASGVEGGRIELRADLAALFDYGGVARVDGSSGNGGELTMSAPSLFALGSFDASGRNGGTMTFTAPVTPQLSTATLDGEFLLTGDAGGRGGTFRVLAPAILFGPVTNDPFDPPDTRIDASGGAGGSVELHAGSALAMASRARINADASSGGNGGSVQLLSDGSARIHGLLSARGSGNGNGGDIETSAAGIDITGLRIDASATAGNAGRWLIDPFDVTIVHGAASGSLPSNPFEPVAASIVQDGDINAALDGGTSVRITTGVGGAPGDGDITLSNSAGAVVIARTVGTARVAFQLDANRSIFAQNGFSIDAGDGPMDVQFNSNANNTAVVTSEDAGIVLDSGSINTNGGNVWFYGQSDSTTGVAGGENQGIDLFASTIDTRGGSGDGEIRLRGRGGNSGVALIGSTLLSGGGDINLYGRTIFGGYGVSLDGISDGTVFRNLLQTAGGDIGVDGASSAAFGTPTGVSVSYTTMLASAGTIDVRGRSEIVGASGSLTGTGVLIGTEAVVGDAGTARVQLTGEALADVGSTPRGLVVDADCGQGAACVQADNVVLRARNGQAGKALLIDGAVTGTSVVNLRPGGVDSSGAGYDAIADAIIFGAGGGFSLTAAELGRIATPLLVLGSDTHAGTIAINEALTRTGNVSLHNDGGSGGIALDAAVDLGTGTLGLLSAGDIAQSAAGTITAGSLLARSTGGDVLLSTASNNVAATTLAGSAAGDFSYTDVDAVSIGTVLAGGYSAGSNTPLTVTTTGVSAGNDAFVRTQTGNLTLNAGVSAGNNLDLVTAGTLQNAASATLSAGNRWRVWADSWVGETRGGLVGSGTLPNLYNCLFAGACGVTVPAADNHFIYRAQPTATITLADVTREYGLANPALGFTVDGLVLGDVFGNAFTGAPFTAASITDNVGRYLIDGNFASPAGYAINLLTGNFDITPATLTFIADPFTRLYGDPNGNPTGSVNGFRNGDTLADATSGTLAFTPDADAFSPVGNYASNGGGLSALNYVFVQDASNATAYRIDPATLTYLASPFARLYGDPNGTPTGTVSGFRNGETVASATSGTLAFLLDPSVGASSNVGSYALSGGGLSAQNYVFVQDASNASAYRIDPATLFYVANPLSRFVGEGNGVLGGSVSGLRNGESLAEATTGTLSFTTEAGELAPAGRYAINGGGLSARNYVFEQAEGNAIALTVLGLARALFLPELLLEPPDNYVYDRNLGANPICPATDLLGGVRLKEGDNLAREWSRVRSRPNLLNCVQSNRRYGCDDF